MFLFHSTPFDPAQADDAIAQVEEYVNEHTAAEIVASALERPYCLEFILSALSPGSSQKLADYIISQIPRSATELSSAVIPITCLEKLPITLLEVEYPDTLEASKFEQYRDIAINTLPVLAQLGGMIPKKLAAKQGHRRKSTANRLSLTSVNEILFQKAGASVPRTIDDAEELAMKLLVSVKECLKFFLDSVRGTELEGQLRAAYLRNRLAQDGLENSVVSAQPSYTASIGAQYGLKPLQANLSYSSPSGFGPWCLLTTERIRKKIEKIRKGDRVLFDSIQSRLRELSHGLFSPTNYKRISNASPVDVFEARLPGDARLVYQVDCIRESADDIPHQALLLFGIFDHAEIARISWDDIGRQQGRRGKEYQNACRYRSKARQGPSDTFFPGSFPALKIDLDTTSFVSENGSNSSYSISKSAVQELHYLLVLGKHAALSQPLLDSLLDGSEVATVYQLSAREREAVHCTLSSLLHGRSGTGKTTVITFKIFGIERAWAELSHVYPTRPRQVFVTKSLHLVLKMEHEYLQLARLDALAEHAPRHFIERARRSHLPDLNVLFSAEDLGNWRTGIPQKFSDLKDEDFPLFVTFDELCVMISNSLRPAENKLSGGLSLASGQSLSSLYQDITRPEYVSFDSFMANYWPHLSRELRAAIAPSVAFSEFIGVIKGSEGSLVGSTRLSALDREAYEQRRYQRVRYDDFETYVKLLRRRGEVDVADRTHDLLRELMKHPFPGKKVDFLCVDEAQDNLPIDNILLRQICRNADGLLWAGDIAQTISFGSAFRFEDLTAFLYRYEQAAYASKNLPPKSLERFQLSINYRSPGGIVDCAHSIIELLELFPRAIDSLERERGIVDGMKPLFVYLEAGKNSIDSFFLTDESGQATVGLGAKQCILVRDDAARARLKEGLGEKAGVILTLYQSKGLEFDDVLIYDFFGDSLVGEELWRDLTARAESRSPNQKLSVSMMFEDEDSRHTPLAMDLKFLYVAVTRTRKNLWIVDSSLRCIPIRLAQDYWIHRNLVDLSPGDISISAFADRSAAQDWSEAAIRLFQRQQYDEAAPAFERSGDERRARMAKALMLKQRADRAPPHSRREAYSLAAEALVGSAKDAIDIREERVALFFAAASCFVRLDNHKRAAGAFARAEKWTEAATHYFDAKMLDKAVRVIQEHPRQVAVDVRAHVLSTAKYVYLEDYKSRMDDARSLFESDGQFEEFMGEHGFVDALATWLKRNQDPIKAAHLLFEEGRRFEAIEVLVEYRDVPAVCSLAWNFGLRFLWSRLSLGSMGLLGTQDNQTDATLSLLDQLPASGLAQEEHLTLKMFRAVAQSSIGDIKRLAAKFLSLNRREELVLCLDRYFCLVKTTPQSEIAEFVDMFHAYARHIFRILLDPQRAFHVNADGLSRLLGFQLGSEGYVDLYEHTVVGAAYKKWKSKTASLSHIPIQSLVYTIQASVAFYLKEQINKEVWLAEKLRMTFDPCVSFSLHDHCDGGHDSAITHDTSKAWHLRRVQFYLRQIAILDISHNLPCAADSFQRRVHQQREWLALLENAANPLIYLHGSWSSIKSKELGSASDDFPIVKKWCLDVLYNLDPTRPTLQQAFLSNFLNVVKLGSRLQRTGLHIMERHVQTAPCLSYARHPGLWTNEPNQPPRYTLHWLADFLVSTSACDVVQGVDFLSVVMNKRLPVDFTVLCDYADRLTGIFILTHGVATPGFLHNTVLPRSLIVELWPDVIRFSGRNSGDVWRLVSILEVLLMDTYEEAISTRKLSLRVKELEPEDARDVCMARLCRDLGFLAIKYDGENIKARILRTLETLRNSAVFPGRLALSKPSVSRLLVKLAIQNIFINEVQTYTRYLQATGWEQFEQAIYRSCQRTNRPDRIVQLFHSSQPAHMLEISGDLVTRVFFREVQDIPSKLGFTVINTPALQPDPRAKIPSQESAESRVPDHQGMGHLITTPAPERSTTTEPQPEGRPESSKRSPDEAARFIQNVWRMHHPPQNELQRWITECRAQSGRGISTRYKAAFFVHLPRLLLCIDWAVAQARAEARLAISRRATVSVTEKVEVGNTVSRIRRVQKDLGVLQRQLDPSSAIHERGEPYDVLAEMRKCAREVDRMIKEIPGSRSAIEDNMALALRGFENAGRWPGVVASGKRKVLNVSDL